MTGHLQLNKEDADTILTMLTAKHRASGYKGPVMICLNRLEEIHMPSSYAHSLLAIHQASIESKGEAQ